VKLTDFQIDASAIEGGTWRDAIGRPGLKFRLRGADNLDWRRLQAKLISEMPREKQFAVATDPADDDAITGRLLVDACLLDWEGLEDETGAIPFSKELASKLLTDPAFRPFRASVLATARVLANETVSEREAAAKN
jgi:hypothetical protein